MWLNSFSNEGCGITRAPFDPSIPLEILNEATFVEKAGKTTVTLRARPHGAEESEIKMFQGMFASLKQGYGGTFDQLASSLAKLLNVSRPISLGDSWAASAPGLGGDAMRMLPNIRFCG